MLSIFLFFPSLLFRQTQSYGFYTPITYFLFFFISKKDIKEKREVPRSTQGVDTRNHPSKKTKDKKNYLLPIQVKKSIIEIVFSSLNMLAQAHRLVTNLALIFWSLEPLFSNTILFLALHRVQNKHRGAASQILLRFLPTSAPCQAKSV